MAYTGVTYFIFCWFREQVCIVLCPYGRIQSALNRRSITVTVGYDVLRGEPRGKPGTPGAGDCIGLQQVRPGLPHRHRHSPRPPDGVRRLHRVHRRLRRRDDAPQQARGLIRYASQNNLARKPHPLDSPAHDLYFVLLFGRCQRSRRGRCPRFGPRISASPASGRALHRERHRTVRNQFLVRIVNKRNQPERFVLSLARCTRRSQPDRAHHGRRSSGARRRSSSRSSCSRPARATPARFIFAVRVADQAGKFQLTRDVEFLGPEAKLAARRRRAEKRHHAKRDDDHSPKK